MTSSDDLINSAEFLQFQLGAAPVFSVELIDGVDDPIIIRSTRVLETMFGYAPGQLNGRPISILIPPAKHGVHKSHILRFLKNPVDRQMGNLGDVEPQGISRGGEIFPIVLMWIEQYLEKRHFLAVTVMPQIYRKDVAAAQKT